MPKFDAMGKASKDKRDAYYRLAKEQGWRARSVYKLMQIDEQFEIFKGVTRAVDLCAAPGSWSQVLAVKLHDKPDRRIVAVDLQAMAPIRGVIQLQGDITSLETAERVVAEMGGEKVDLVVCDGAPDVTGLHDWDEYMQIQLLMSALSIATYLLRHGGTFVSKVFRARRMGIVALRCREFFADVHVAKPRASRNSSCEAFIVCKDYTPPPNFTPKIGSPCATGMCACGCDKAFEPHLVEQVAPCECVGDERSYSSDSNYTHYNFAQLRLLHDELYGCLQEYKEDDITEEADIPAKTETDDEATTSVAMQPLEGDDLTAVAKRVLDPIQPPIDPPYAYALKLKRANKLPPMAAYGELMEWINERKQQWSEEDRAVYEERSRKQRELQETKNAKHSADDDVIGEAFGGLFLE